MSSSTSTSTPATSPDQSKLTVPMADARPTAQGSGDLSRTSTVSIQSDGSPCPSLLARSDDNASSDNVTENETPPESPGRTSAKVYSDSSSRIQQGTVDQTPETTFSTVDSRQKAKAISGDGSPRGRGSLLRALSVMFKGAKHQCASGSRIFKRKSQLPSLELPSVDQSGPFTTSPQGSRYGSPPPCSRELSNTLSNIAEVSREGSQASQSPSNRPDGLPFGTALNPIVVLTPPDQQSQGHSACPSAPRIQAVRLPQDTIDGIVLEEDISPLHLHSFHSPLHLWEGSLVGASANRGNTYNPYFPSLDGQVRSSL